MWSQGKSIRSRRHSDCSGPVVMTPVTAYAPGKDPRHYSNLWLEYGASAPHEIITVLCKRATILALEAPYIPSAAQPPWS